MTDLSAHAVERYRLLQERADAAFERARQHQFDLIDLRREVNRLETMLQSYGNGPRVLVDEGGRPFVERVGYGRVQETGLATLREQPVGRLYLDEGQRVDHALVAAAKAVHRERSKLREATARGPELVRRSEVFGELARTCRAELERRGWTEDDTSGRVVPGQVPIERARPTA